MKESDLRVQILYSLEHENQSLQMLMSSKHCHCLLSYVGMSLSPSSCKSKHPSNVMAPAYKTARLRLERT